MKAKSIKGSSPEEIKSALADSMTDGFTPTLAFVFLSVKQDRIAIAGLLDEKGITIFGATTSGEFIDGDITSGGIAILLLDMDKASFHLMLEDYSGKDVTTIANAMTESAFSMFKNPVFLLSHSLTVPDGLTVGEPIIRSIEKVAGAGASIWGGVAGDDTIFKETFVFTNKKSLVKGILLLVLDGDKIQVKGKAASGWKSVGTEKTITKAIDNWVYEIDHQPAAEMVLKYMGLNLTKEEAETFNPGVTVFSILQAKGEPLMRSSGIFNWANKSIAVNGNIKEGDKIRLTLPPDFEMVETVTKDAERIHKTEMQEADALVMFSCVGRLGEFGPMISDEINGVKNAFNVPMAGFFCYGEFGRLTNGTNEYHNHTCCWVSLKER
jgi:hypothetical protein